MKIARVEHLHADAGQRNFDFLKITTDNGLVGWSEYNESFGGLGVSAVIDGLAPLVIGRDARAWEAIVTQLYAVRRQASGGVIQQAIGAIENALLDVKAKALGVPVYELLGGPQRDRIRLYWSHCGTYRLQWSKEMQIPALRTLQDCVNMGKEVVSRGYTALKTNVFVLGADAYLHSPGFARRGPGFPELNADRHVLSAMRDQLAAFREGTGPDVDILVDLNFNFKTEGFLKVARAIEPFDIFWIEIDTRDARGAALHPLAHHDSRRLLRVPVRPPRLPAVLRAPVGGRGHHRHAVERRGRVGQDRGDGRRLRGQRGARTTSTATWPR